MIVIRPQMSLAIVLTAINKANLQINLEKSEFCCTRVKYLGYVIDADGLHTDPDRVQKNLWRMGPSAPFYSLFIQY